MDKTRLVSVVIVNYNGLHCLPACVESVGRAFRRHRHEIVVVDNASTDGSREWLAARTYLKCIYASVNMGFAKGCNLGAKAGEGDLILLLNSDAAIVAPLDDWVDQLGQLGVAALGGRLVSSDGRTQPAVGYDHHPLRLVLSWLGLAAVPWLPNMFRRMECAESYYDQVHADVQFVSGACLLTSAAVWRELGGLDERYFMYCEDVDYCKRVRATGRKVGFSPLARIRHLEFGGKRSVRSMAIRRSVRSYGTYLRVHHGARVATFTMHVLGFLFLLRGAVLSVIYPLFVRQMQVRDEASALIGAGLELLGLKPPGVDQVPCDEQ